MDKREGVHCTDKKKVLGLLVGECVVFLTKSYSKKERRKGGGCSLTKLCSLPYHLWQPGNIFLTEICYLSVHLLHFFSGGSS